MEQEDKKFILSDIKDTEQVEDEKVGSDDANEQNAYQQPGM